MMYPQHSFSHSHSSGSYSSQATSFGSASGATQSDNALPSLNPMSSQGPQGYVQPSSLPSRVQTQRPLPSMTDLPNRDRLSTVLIPESPVYGSEQFAMNQSPSSPSAISSRKPLPQPPSLASISSNVVPNPVPPDSRSPPPSIGGRGSPAPSFKPAWQQYRRLGGGAAAAQSTAPVQDATPRRALPVPTQRAAAEFHHASPVGPTSIDFIPHNAVTLPSGSVEQFSAIMNSAEKPLSRPSSVAPNPPPLPPRVLPNRADSEQMILTARSPSPSRAGRKLPTAPIIPGAVAKISAIESFRSMASPPPGAPFLTSRPEIRTSSSHVQETHGPTTGSPSSPGPTNSDEQAHEATLHEAESSEIQEIPVEAGDDEQLPQRTPSSGTTSQVAEAVKAPPLNRPTPPPLPPRSPPPSATSVEARARPSFSGSLNRAVPSTSSRDAYKLPDSTTRTRSPPPRFSSYVPDGVSSTPSLDDGDPPQSMAMRMAALSLQEEDAAEMRARSSEQYVHGGEIPDNAASGSESLDSEAEPSPAKQGPSQPNFSISHPPSAPPIPS
ncbi:hypothetical protein DL93DRAFT_213390 [Clavulina sp. PMI_390]|nr:hypothetical protein DL93DRAFT_213390 [Clavulina sp. PMI_390]